MQHAKAKTMEYTFPVGTLRDCSVPICVESRKTATPGLIITPHIGPRNDPSAIKNWPVITHASTGCLVPQPTVMKNIKQARYIAGAFGGLDINWEGKPNLYRVPAWVRRWYDALVACEG